MNKEKIKAESINGIEVIHTTAPMNPENTQLLRDIHDIFKRTGIKPQEALKIKEKNPELFKILKAQPKV